MTESERKRIPHLCSREAKGTTTMLFSFEGGNAKSKVLSIRRRTQKPRRDIDLDKFAQVLRGNCQ